MEIIPIEMKSSATISSFRSQESNDGKSASTFSYLLRVLGDCYEYSLFEEIVRTGSNGVSKALLSKIIPSRKMLGSCLDKLRYLDLVYANGKMYFATPFGEVSSSLKIINDAISIQSRLRIVDAVLPTCAMNLDDDVVLRIESLVEHKEIREILKRSLYR